MPDKYNPILIFAEGGITNGTSLVQFKKGGFLALKRLTPIYMKFEYSILNPAYTFDLISLVIMHLSTFDHKCTLYQMPDFEPNEYLFENHSH